MVNTQPVQAARVGCRPQKNRSWASAVAHQTQNEAAEPRFRHEGGASHFNSAHRTPGHTSRNRMAAVTNKVTPLPTMQPSWIWTPRAPRKGGQSQRWNQSTAFGNVMLNPPPMPASTRKRASSRVRSDSSSTTMGASGALPGKRVSDSAHGPRQQAVVGPAEQV